MRFLVLFLLLISINAYSKSFLVYNHTPTVKVILGNDKCFNEKMRGTNAMVVQTNSNKQIRGCWYYVDDNKNIRIDWDNPSSPGDFAVIDINKFKLEE